MNRRTEQPASTPELIVQLSTAQLRALMAEAVTEALADHEPEQRPALLDQAGLARELGVSTRTIYTLRQQGMPSLQIGDSPRFELHVVLAWLRAQSEQLASPATGEQPNGAVLVLDRARRRHQAASTNPQRPAGSNDSKDLGGRR